jgi:hypothetical protein
MSKNTDVLVDGAERGSDVEPSVMTGGFTDLGVLTEFESGGLTVGYGARWTSSPGKSREALALVYASPTNGMWNGHGAWPGLSVAYGWPGNSGVTMKVTSIPINGYAAFKTTVEGLLAAAGPVDSNGPGWLACRKVRWTSVGGFGHSPNEPGNAAEHWEHGAITTKAGFWVSTHNASRVAAWVLKNAVGGTVSLHGFGYEESTTPLSFGQWSAQMPANSEMWEGNWLLLVRQPTLPSTF